MKKEYIDYAVAGFSGLLTDYTRGEAFLRPFYKYSPDIKEIRNSMEAQKGEPVDRAALVSTLTAQNESYFTEYALLARNIEALTDSNTFTVTTGHQLSMFTGPLFFVYKILSAVSLAEKLTAEYPDSRFVPVYWMASEDHDFDEIKSLNLFGKKITWEQEQTGMTGKIDTSSCTVVLEQVRAILGDSENAASLYRIFEEAYGRNKTLAEATRHLVISLFGKYGLVVIDADEKVFKERFKSVVSDDIFNNTAYKLVAETGSRLEEKYKIQVYPREINCFYIQDRLRERIELSDGKYRVVNTSMEFTREELEREIADCPERFSPNVVLRPLLQEMILPNIAMIGGPAEVAYWLEYKSLFEKHSVNFPMLVMRNSLMWIDKSTAARMDKFGISGEELFDNTDAIIKRYVQEENEISLAAEMEMLERAYTGVVDKAVAVDVTLKASVEADRQKQLGALKSIEDRIIRAQKKRYETDIQQIRNLKDRLFPGGSLQERYDNFIPYYLKYGPAFFDILLESFSPLPDRFMLLSEEQ